MTSSVQPVRRRWKDLAIVGALSAGIILIPSVKGFGSPVPAPPADAAAAIDRQIAVAVAHRSVVAGSAAATPPLPVGHAGAPAGPVPDPAG